MEHKTSFVIQTKKDRGEIEATIAEIKSLIAGFQRVEALMEKKKRVLNVATPAGVDRYGLPLGSIIGGNGKHLTHIWIMGKPDADGNFQIAKDEKGRTLIEGTEPNPRFEPGDKVTQGEVYTMEKHRGGKVTVRDSSGAIVETESGTKLQNVDEDVALESLNEESKRRALASDSTKFRRIRNKERGSRPVPPGMRKATYEDLKRYGLLTSKLTDIAIWDDGKEHDTGGVGYAKNDANAKQSFKRPRGEGAEEEREVIVRLAEEAHTKKMLTVKKMEPKIPMFMAQTVKDAMGRDKKKAAVAGAVLVMRITGMRVDSEGKANSYGATTLEVQHIEAVSGSTVTFRFLGKNGLNYFDIDDPDLAKVVRKAMQGKKKTDRLFPGADDNLTNLYIAEHIGKGTTNKHLRAFRAMEVARENGIPAVLEAYDGKKASSEEELFEMADSLGEFVADYALYDSSKDIAFKHYLDPYVLKPLVPPGPKGLKWIEAYAKQIATKR